MLLNALRCLLVTGVAILAAGCRECDDRFEATIPLRADEMGKPCEEVCMQVLVDLDIFEYLECRSGSTEEGAPAAVCSFIGVSICPGPSHV